MNEKEKEAIEKVFNFAKFTIDEYGKKEDNKYLKIVKNLISKQQKEIKARLEEIDSLYKMMSVKDDEIKYLEGKLEQMGSDYQILKDDIEEHRIAYVDTPEFEEKYISKDKIKKKMRGEINKSWRNTEQRKCQLYAYDILKELLQEGKE